MDQNPWNKTTILVLAGLALLLAGLGAFYFVNGVSGSPIYTFVSIGVAALIFIIGIAYVILVAKGKIKQTEPDYRTLFILGVVFMMLGMSGSGSGSFFGIGIVFIAVGLINRKKWKEQPKWSELPRAQRNFKITLIILLGLLVLVGLIARYLGAQ